MKDREREKKEEIHITTSALKKDFKYLIFSKLIYKGNIFVELRFIWW